MVAPSLFEWPDSSRSSALPECNPVHIEVGDFYPAEVPELLDRAIRKMREKTGEQTPYTFQEYRRLCTDGYITPPPYESDPSLYARDYILDKTPSNSRLYALRRGKIYLDACLVYNRLKTHEKTALKFARTRHGNNAPTFSDYLAFVTTHYSQELRPFFRPWRLPIPESDRRLHTIVTAKTGYGKSSLLKVLSYGYIASKEATCSVVIFDPHGDFALETAQLREHLEPERLIYFDPRLHPDYTPVINPFDISDRSPEMVDRVAQELVGAFQAILTEKDVAFTPQMEQVLSPCITALLLRDGSSILDLRDFMDDEKNGNLYEFALKNLKNPIHVDFLKTDFRKAWYNQTKQAIKTRISTILSPLFCYNCLVGKSTIDLRKEIERRSTIVFNISDGSIGQVASKTLGQLFVGLLQGYAQQRADIPEEKRHPTHAFIDECEAFVTQKVERILKESRKYRLYLTLAQQVFGHEPMTPQLRDTILSNTAVKITGGNALKTLKTMSAETGADLADLQTLKRFQFHVKTGERPSVKITTPDFLMNRKKYYMTPEEWENTVQDQIARYYRKKDDAPGGTPGSPIHGRKPIIIDI